MAMVIKRVTLDAVGLPVYHFAPEIGVARLLGERFGANYRPADIDPAAFEGLGVPVARVDLCHPLRHMPAGSAGGLVHSHVLEHIPVSLERLLRDLNSTIAPGGFHLFQAPIHSGWYREDVDPDMDPATRTERFYQEDHVRCFGTEDFAERVLALFEDDFDRIDIAALFKRRELMMACIPPSALDSLTGHSAFLFVKRPLGFRRKVLKVLGIG